MEEETKILASRRSSGAMPSFSDTVFGFLDENYPLSGNSSTDTFEEQHWVDDEEDDDEICISERKAYWDEQEKHLNGILCKTSSIESRVRNATKEALKQLEGTINCDCWGDVSVGCRDCLRLGIFDHLSNTGFICLVQKSKWKSCHQVPSGEHTYLEVVEKSSSSTEEVRVIIEINFRAEFEMGRASQEYNQLIQKLPQVYVGKPETLRKMIIILCRAAKKCMKDKKMHLAPWRKHEYMQAKWLNSCNQFIFTTTTTTPTIPQISLKFPHQMVKPRDSMLTQSLIEELSTSHCQIIKVL